MTHTDTLRRRSFWPTALLLAACAGAPTDPNPGAAAENDTTATPASSTPAGATPISLPNGMACFALSAPPGDPTQIQYGVFAGSLFVAPGAAELAAYTLLHSTDATKSQSSLAQRIERLGGSIEARVGLTTTWFDVRTPEGQTGNALRILRESLENVTRSRTQIDRMREELVARTTAEVVRDPLAAAARRLLHADGSSGAHLNGLLDLDPSTVTLFHTRLYRPERSVLAIRTPQSLDRVTQSVVGDDRSLGRWAPSPALPGESPLMPREFRSGLYWSESLEKPSATRCAIVMRLPDATAPAAAEWLVMHACLTLDGVGGRLEQLQDEAGLSHLQWEARFEQTPEVMALVMSTTATPAEVARLWQLYERARRSLVEVPPSASELQIALRRARLNAGLPTLSATDRQRLEVNLAIRGIAPGALEARIEELADAKTWDQAQAAAAFQATPAWMVAIGPDRPEALPGLVATETLPSGFDPVTRNQPTPENLAAAAPWLQRARAATGGDARYATLKGFTAKATKTSEQGLEVQDELSWSVDGSLTRERTLLGQRIRTVLDKQGGHELLDGERKGLAAREVALLRHEWMRHPQMLLNAHLQGRLSFRPVARRTLGDREVYVVEAVGEEFDRLRLQIDTESRLIRVVESWERLPDETLVHVVEEWSDYRDAAGMRVPHRRRTTWNDGQRHSETVFSEWRPR